ncbi:MAG TPA: hypothetical protein PLD49_10960, partial [Thermoclostridium caenicola]|uniref:hypothetical protein n=1 Tax=Thermoclostridium caenicola TaxID=659425 RepID=UPI002BE109A6
MSKQAGLAGAPLCKKRPAFLAGTKYCINEDDNGSGGPDPFDAFIIHNGSIINVGVPRDRNFGTPT